MTRLRGLLFALYFWILSAAMTIGLSPLLLIGPRRSIVWAMQRWAALTMAGLRLIAGVRVAVRGRDHIPAGGALVASKHLSMWETMAFHLLLPDPAMVMKSELSRVPLYGLYAKRARMIIVDRKAGAKALRGMIVEAKARLAEGRQIVIFPEGTRVAPGAPPDYKSGIAALYGQLGMPCIPVALNSGLFWPKRGLIRKSGTIVIEFLPPLPAGLSREAFMAALQETVETATAKLLKGSEAGCG